MTLWKPSNGHSGSGSAIAAISWCCFKNGSKGFWSNVNDKGGKTDEKFFYGEGKSKKGDFKNFLPLLQLQVPKQQLDSHVSSKQPLQIRKLSIIRRRITLRGSWVRSNQKEVHALPTNAVSFLIQHASLLCPACCIVLYVYLLYFFRRTYPRCHPIDPFIAVALHDQEIGKVDVVQRRRTTDFQDPNLCKGRSGSCSIRSKERDPIKKFSILELQHFVDPLILYARSGTSPATYLKPSNCESVGWSGSWLKGDQWTEMVF